MIGLLYTSRGISLLVAPPAVAFAGGEAWPLVAIAVLGIAGTALLPVAANMAAPNPALDRFCEIKPPLAVVSAALCRSGYCQGQRAEIRKEHSP